MALCLDMFMAGSETTNNSISFGMMYLVLNPDVQKKAQEEIDKVLGGRPATMDDRTKLVPNLFKGIFKSKIEKF